MKKEFGKWLMDIAKYVTTAVLLSTVFGGVEEKWLVLIMGFVIVGICLGWGMYLIKDRPHDKKRSINQHRRNRK